MAHDKSPPIPRFQYRSRSLFLLQLAVALVLGVAFTLGRLWVRSEKAKAHDSAFKFVTSAIQVADGRIPILR